MAIKCRRLPIFTSLLCRSTITCGWWKRWICFLRRITPLRMSQFITVLHTLDINWNRKVEYLLLELSGYLLPSNDRKEANNMFGACPLVFWKLLPTCREWLLEHFTHSSFICLVYSFLFIVDVDNNKYQFWKIYSRYSILAAKKRRIRVW